MLELKRCSDDLLPNINYGKIRDIKYIPDQNINDVIVIVRRNSDLYGLKYEPSWKEWKIQWNSSIFSVPGEYTLKKYPWVVSTNLQQDFSAMILRHPNGVKLFDLGNKYGPKELNIDPTFHEVYGDEIIFGDFYKDPGYYGVMARSSSKQIHFYAATAGNLDPVEKEPLYPLNNDISLDPSWNDPVSRFYVTKLMQKSQSLIGVREEHGLTFYNFNDEYLLDPVITLSNIPRSKGLDEIYFSNSLNQTFQDILHLNTSGLYLYKYNIGISDYEVINHNIDFSRDNGWLPDYTDTIHLADLNMDGQDDILFTGSKGLEALSFSETTSKWETLINPEVITGKDRYAAVVGTLPPIPQVVEEPSLFSQDSLGKTKWFKIVKSLSNSDVLLETDDEDNTLDENTTNPTHVNSSVKLTEKSRYGLQEKPDLFWAEQVGFNILKNPVDALTGKIKWSIPLSDISFSTGWEFRLSLSYNSGMVGDDTVGVGWMLPLDQDFIIVDQRGSIFPEDAQYYLVSQGNYIPIKCNDSDGDMKTFVLENEKDNNDGIKILYNKIEQQWVVENESEKNIYGKAGDKNSRDIFIWSLRWPNWLGPGRDTENLEPQIIGWYLNSRQKKYLDQSLYYYYQTDEDYIAGKAYTSSIRLKSVRDSENLKITFHYDKKSEEEYTTFEAKDKDGNFNFPVRTTQTHYLTSYELHTDDYKQEFHFSYQVNDKVRLLTNIYQKVLHYKEPILKFSYYYNGRNHYLSRCELWNDVTMNFSFQSRDVIPATTVLNNMVSYPTGEMPKIANGPNYAVVAHRSHFPNTEIIELLLMNRELTRRTETRLLRYSDAKAYAIQAFQKHILLLVQTDVEKVIQIFYHDGKNWSDSPCEYKFDKDAAIRFNDRFVVAVPPGQNIITIYENTGSSCWVSSTKLTERRITNFQLQGNTIVCYDDNKLFILQRRNQDWEKRTLYSDFENLNQRAIDLFDLNLDTRNSLLNFLNENKLQISRNLILISGIDEENGYLNSLFYLFLVDDDYKIVSSKRINRKRDNIMNLSYDINEDGSTFRLGYKQENNRYKIEVQTLQGKVIEDILKISNRNLRSDALEARLKEINKLPEWNKMFKSRILVELDSYFNSVQYNGASLGEDLKISYTGRNWEEDGNISSEPVNLGKHFIIEKGNSERSLQLYKNEFLIRNLELLSFNHFVNQFPSYIAYMSEQNTTHVITFTDENTIGQEYQFENEWLISESDEHNLLTFLPHQYEINVRPFSSLMPPKQDLYVKHFSIEDRNEVRQTGYYRHYHSDKEKLVFSEIVQITPANKTDVSGWIDVTIQTDFRTGNETITEKLYDADGKEVFKLKEEERREDESDTRGDWSSIFDISKRWVITDFSPYNISHQIGGYFGFESYETSQIASNTMWIFDNNQVIKKRFAFTGENYLKVDDKSFLEGVFEPEFQDITYLAACWIRCNEFLNINSSVTYLQAVIKTTAGVKIVGLNGTVKYIMGNWYYLEVMIDFPTIRDIYRDYLEQEMLEFDDAKFTITLIVKTPPNETLDLDHIRFTPMNLDFKATVYNPFSGNPTAMIGTNGMVSRNIYNRFQQEIASVKENGEVIEFRSFSRGGQILRQTQTIQRLIPSDLFFIPEKGINELFDQQSLKSRWIFDESVVWDIAPGQILHQHSSSNTIRPQHGVLHNTSNTLRFYVALEEEDSYLSMKWEGFGYITIHRASNGSATLIRTSGDPINQLLPTGEIIIMVEENVVWLWFNGVLILEQVFSMTEDSPSLWTLFTFELKGNVVIEDLITMNNPEVKIEYTNGYGDKTQTIQLETSKTVLVSEMMYDQIGREAITSKTTRLRRQYKSPILTYCSNFISNKNVDFDNSVWATGKMEGEVNRLNSLDGGVPFTQTLYAPSPLNQKMITGLPGLEYSVNGKYATKHSDNSNVSFIENLFPRNRGYYQEVDETPNGSKRIHVFDKLGMEVARYIRVSSYDHHLSTFEYDGRKRLVKILPPLYHEKEETSLRSFPWESNEWKLSAEEEKLQDIFATRFFYNSNNQLVKKITPDTGITEFVYDDEGRKRYMIFQNKDIVYLDYDINGELSRSGLLENVVSVSELQSSFSSEANFTRRDYQMVYNAEDHYDPLSRTRLRYVLTHNEDEQSIVERIKFNSEGEITTKDVIASSDDETGEDDDIKRTFFGNKLRVLKYPTTFENKTLEVMHTYNKLGQLIALGTPESPNRFVTFSYMATGVLASETFGLGTEYGFTREYDYNSPGFLTEISDPFLSEHIDYENLGYGHSGYGDGMVMGTTFEPKWLENVDNRWFKIRKDELGGNYSQMCLEALRNSGYLNNGFQPVKLYNVKRDNSQPLVCRGQTSLEMARLVAQKFLPRQYGHKYAYGSHQELKKAKYFTLDTNNEPLLSHAFESIPGINSSQSVDIFQSLSSSDFIIVDPVTKIGKQGKWFFQIHKLHDDLRNLKSNYVLYVEPIARFIVNSISQASNVTLTDFIETFLMWEGTSVTLLNRNRLINIATEIGKMLLDQKYLGEVDVLIRNTLNETFIGILNKYSSFIPQIVEILLNHFAHALGESPFDVESYDIDANGNHKHFYTGFDRVELIYENNTNKVKHVKLGFSDEIRQNGNMEHDTRGNVIRAMHKGIESIEYHPVSQRTTRIQLKNKKYLKFYYDAQGERVIKRVFNPDGEITDETFYLRDEKGRVLLDRRTRYLSGSNKSITTAYLYGKRGMIGFVRNNNFFQVFTDHSGSVRLITREGRVVAAYDYLPYGQIMRCLGDDLDAHIFYRYTEQEWDEETGLYNYHARLYDPSVGRFYQPDPKSQYFSPYKYSGNSPVSVVDPDGEFAFIIAAIVLGIAGAYLGGAAANNRWNPLEWDFKDRGTWLGMIGGAISGVTLVAITLTTLPLGIAFAYISTSAVNGTWNPAKWNWKSPGTWSALFQGISAGGGVSSLHRFAKDMSTLSKILFLTGSYSGGVGLAYFSGVKVNGGEAAFWKWNWSSPNTWSALVGGFNSGIGLAEGIGRIALGTAKLLAKVGTLKQAKQIIGKFSIKTQAIKNVLKNKRHPLYKAIFGLVMAYFMGAQANNDFDVTKWNLADYSTYEGLLNGIFLAKDVKHIYKQAQKNQQNIIQIINKVKHFNIYNSVLSLLKKSMVNFFKNNPGHFKGANGQISNDMKLSHDDGFQILRKGKSEPPMRFENLLSGEADSNVLLRKVKSAEYEIQKLLDENRIIQPDEDYDYLNCHRIAKRQTNAPGRRCFILRGTEDQNKYVNSMDLDLESLNNILDLPKIHATTSPQFYTSLILAAASRRNTNNNQPKYVQMNKKQNILKICTLEGVGSQMTLKFETFMVKNTPKEGTKVTSEDVVYMKTQFGVDEVNVDSVLYEIGVDNKISTTKNSPVEQTSNEETTGTFTKLEIKNTDTSVLEKLKSDDVNVVKEGVEELSNDILEQFSQIKGMYSNPQEATIHGYFYGALASLSKEHRLNLINERVAGRGYLDLAMMVGNGPNDWKAIPVIIEFKKGSETSDAVAQILRRGYMYHMGMKSLSNDFVLLGVNINGKTSTQSYQFPKKEGLIKSLLDGSHENSENFKSSLERELKHLYFSNTPLSSKSSVDHYLSNFILGDIISTGSIEAKTKIYDDNLTSFSIRDKSSDKWIMLNIFEGNDDFFSKNIVTENVFNKLATPNNMIGEFLRVDVMINSKSKTDFQDYFQGLEVTKSSAQQHEVFDEISNIDMQPFYENGNMQPIFEKLNDVLRPIENHIGQQSDIQSILQGLFSHESDNTVVRVFPEMNPSVEGRINLVVDLIKKNGDNMNQENIYVLDTVLTKTNPPVNRAPKLDRRVNKLHKRTRNLNTDSDDVTEVVVKYYKGGNSNGRRLYTSFSLYTPGTSSRGKRDLERSFNESYEIASVYKPKETVTSGSGRSLFWVADMYNCFMNSFFSVDKPAIPDYFSSEHTHKYEFSDTILNIGDNCVANADINGLLTWGLLLINKWTGKKLTTDRYNLKDDSEHLLLNIQASELANEFLDSISGNIEDYIDSTIYGEMVAFARKQITIGIEENIIFDGLINILDKHVDVDQIRIPKQDDVIYNENQEETLDVIHERDQEEKHSVANERGFMKLDPEAKGLCSKNGNLFTTFLQMEQNYQNTCSIRQNLDYID